ncbi:lamin-B receptor domain-containing protein [Pseudomonas phage EM]|uniref:Lamin-B receptor domain-containing protein n=1 Tax=Pseudomonas phage EM TaxID=2936914 RepID=A0AAE9KSS2_9CAUD|nr:lamin-B receptor domain-containing protein [Pseudomonas phage EM]UPW35897.1 lamin-B receptor domain-containing protein [Pseudomonas phage EM]
MELKNVKKGQIVQVDGFISQGKVLRFEERNAGQYGVVESLDKSATNLTVRVQFDDGSVDWGHHDELRLVHSGVEENKARLKLVKKVRSKMNKLCEELYKYY